MSTELVEIEQLESVRDYFSLWFSYALARTNVTGEGAEDRAATLRDED